MIDLLKILALEPDDLCVISAHMQDAVIRLADIQYSRKSRQFVLVVNRFEADIDSGSKTGHRRRTGISFSQVINVRAKNVRQGVDDAVLSLLAMEFVAEDKGPEGFIKLTFSGGGTIELEVECIEVQMEDLGARWATGNVPAHE